MTTTRKEILIGEDFLAGAPAALVLGDNIFHGHDLSHLLQRADRREQGATIFAYAVHDPERYGIAEFTADGRVLSLEENRPSPNRATPSPDSTSSMNRW